MSTSDSRVLEDGRIGVRLKISALWIAMLFLFAYGDIFGFFAPGQIEEVMRGEISGTEITRAFLFGVSVYIAIAGVMVYLSLVLSPGSVAGSTLSSQPCTSSPSWSRRLARRRRTSSS